MSVLTPVVDHAVINVADRLNEAADGWRYILYAGQWRISGEGGRCVQPGAAILV